MFSEEEGMECEDAFLLREKEICVFFNKEIYKEHSFLLFCKGRKKENNLSWSKVIISK